MTKREALFAALTAAVVAFAPAAIAADVKDAAAKLGVEDLVLGAGSEAIRHARIIVHYEGWLDNGIKFDSSVDRDKPMSFTLGAGQVIDGWDKGIVGMRIGGRRQLIIPPALAYGKRGAGTAIPPNATLRFEVRLLSVAPPRYSIIPGDQVMALVARGATIVDLRSSEEWLSTGVIQGSKRLSAFNQHGKFNRDFPSEFEKLIRRSEPVILVSRNGDHSATIAFVITEEADYTTVYNLDGGIAKWVADGNPLAR